MTIISKRERIKYTRRTHEFRHTSRPGGYSFDVDEHGEPVLRYPRMGWVSYIRAILGPEYAPDGYEFDGENFVHESPCINQGIISNTYSYWEPAKKRCSCGEVVRLERFTNNCRGCDADYNMNGQILAPREHWGEETGEHWSECY